MRASDFKRDDCLVGRRRRMYRELEREWRCKHCGARLILDWGDLECYPDKWYMRCQVKCEPPDFIHEAELARRKADAIEVLDGLPEELAAQLE